MMWAMAAIKLPSINMRMLLKYTSGLSCPLRQGIYEIGQGDIELIRVFQHCKMSRFRNQGKHGPGDVIPQVFGHGRGGHLVFCPANDQCRHPDPGNGSGYIKPAAGGKIAMNRFPVCPGKGVRQRSGEFLPVCLGDGEFGNGGDSRRGIIFQTVEDERVDRHCNPSAYRHNGGGFIAFFDRKSQADCRAQRMADQNRLDDAGRLYEFLHERNIGKHFLFPRPRGPPVAGQIQSGNIEVILQGENLLVPILIGAPGAVDENKGLTLRGETVIVAPEGDPASFNRCLVHHNRSPFDFKYLIATVRFGNNINQVSESEPGAVLSGVYLRPPNSADLFVAASTAAAISSFSPPSSSTIRPASVVPPGVATIPLSSEGCFSPFRQSFAEPIRL